MDFVVTFRRPGMSVIRASGREIGLEELDHIREEVGVPHLGAHRVDGYVAKIVRPTYSILLTEAEARQTGHFQHRHHIWVETSFNLAPLAVKETVVATRDDTTGAVCGARLTYYVDEQALKNAWAEAGHPLKWEWKEAETEEEEA